MAASGYNTIRMARAWTRQRTGALGGGLIATLVGGIMYSLGWLDHLNGYNLDLRLLASTRSTWNT